MSLPPGFGRGDTYWKEKDPDKCECNFWQKSLIGVNYGRGPSSVHGIINDGHDRRKAAFVILLMTVSMTALILGISTVVDIDREKQMQEIQNLNCGQLADFIADNYGHSVAEHRYEWLCVAEQSKEFQG